MKNLRRAVIDVGTNSVKLLVAEIQQGAVQPLHESTRQTRLGAGFYETHRLRAAAIQQTAEAVRDFVQSAHQREAREVRIIATSAARDALNRDELLQAIQGLTGHSVQVVSGELEARWVFEGVSSDPLLAGRPLLILDAGGGSSEFILGENRVQYFRESFRLGSVRLMEHLRPTDPPSAKDWRGCQLWLDQFIHREIAPLLQPARHRLQPRTVQLVGSGGAASVLAMMHLNLAAFDRRRIDAARLTLADVARCRERLWRLPLAERRRLTGVPPDRADIMLAGAAIYEAVMAHLEFDDLRTTTRGLRYGAILGV